MTKNIIKDISRYTRLSNGSRTMEKKLTNVLLNIMYQLSIHF